MGRAVLESVVLVMVLAAALLLSAGRLDWPLAWAVLGVWVAFAVVGFLVLSPDLIAERSQVFPAGAKRCDLVLGSLGGFFYYPATLVVCGLDARFAWSPPIPDVARFPALALFALGYAFALWAAHANPFLSTVVRIQRERGHRVVEAGPYAIVRHPAYAGALFAHLAVPIALGSLWGLVPAACGAATFALRIVEEERTLADGLEGYSAYALRVRWRLVPGVW